VSEAARERRVKWLSRFGYAALWILGRTWRVRYTNAELLHAEHSRSGPVILALWHGQILPILWAIQYRHMAVMVSEHSDGEIIARVCAALGLRLVRGSTSRGAARALLGAAKEVDAGLDLAITPDGPRGPARSVAPGALVIAQRTGAPVMPMAAAAGRFWRLNSWDGFMIPKPFTRVTITYGAPIRIDSDAARKAAEASNALQTGINAAIAAAEAAP
jgi:lysophospholipid acyltransferase (LPLAT)-like uncharacterized protein